MRHDATTKIDHNHTNELIEQNSIINYLLYFTHQVCPEKNSDLNSLFSEKTPFYIRFHDDHQAVV